MVRYMPHVWLWSSLGDGLSSQSITKTYQLNKNIFSVVFGFWSLWNYFGWSTTNLSRFVSFTFLFGVLLFNLKLFFFLQLNIYRYMYNFIKKRFSQRLRFVGASVLEEAIEFWGFRLRREGLFGLLISLTVRIMLLSENVFSGFYVPCRLYLIINMMLWLWGFLLN